MAFDYDIRSHNYIETMWRANNGTWHLKGDARGRSCKSGIEFRQSFKNANSIGTVREDDNVDAVRRNRSALRALIHAHPDAAREVYRRKMNGLNYEEMQLEQYNERDWDDG